jgi:hypothetical protein
MDFVSRLEEKLKSLEKAPRRSAKKKIKAGVPKSTNKKLSSSSGTKIPSKEDDNNEQTLTSIPFPSLSMTQLSPLKDRTEDLSKIQADQHKEPSCLDTANKINSMASGNGPQGEVEVAIRESEGETVVSETTPPLSFTSPSATPSSTRFTSPEKKTPRIKGETTIATTKTSAAYESPKSRKSIPVPTRKSSTKQHIARQKKARQKKQQMDASQLYFEKESVTAVQSSTTVLTTAEEKSKNAHIRRQKIGRQIRNNKSKNHIGSTVPDFEVGTHYVYESLESKKRRLMEEEEHRIREKEYEKSKQMFSDDSNTSSEYKKNIQAIVLNHNTNEQHAYISQPEGETYGDHKKEMNQDSKETDAVETIGKVYSAHERNVFAVVKSELEEKVELTTSPIKGLGTGLRVSDLFDNHSPYHPRNARLRGGKRVNKDDAINVPIISELIVSSPVQSRSHLLLSSTRLSSGSGRRRRYHENNGDNCCSIKDDNWQHIFNGSGTKQRSIQRKRMEAEENEKKLKNGTWNRIVKQRNVMKKLSSKHINLVVSKSSVKSTTRSYLSHTLTPSRVEKNGGDSSGSGSGSGSKNSLKLSDYHPKMHAIQTTEASLSLGGLMAKAHKTEENLRDALLLLRSDFND